MYKKILIFILVLSVQNLAFSQSDKGLVTKNEVKEKCQQIVDDFSKDDIALAFEKLRNLWILQLDELSYLEQKSIEQLNLVEDRFGNHIGNKFIKEETIDGLLYRLTYVVKFEKHGIRLVFIFYNGKGGKWYLNNFKWDDGMSKLLDD
jgi:hypothetical protein